MIPEGSIPWRYIILTSNTNINTTTTTTTNTTTEITSSSIWMYS